MKRTKIVSTLGPASNQLAVLRQMIAAGVDIVRLNFSHGTADEKRVLVDTVRAAAQAENRVIGILADLQGPKIRVARFKNGSVELKEGAEFILDAELGRDSGDEHQVGIDYKELPQDVGPQDVLLLDDGRIVLTVDHVEEERIFCKVTVGGTLSNNKGINRQFGGLSAGALTDKDCEDLKTAVDLDVDYIAISFVRSRDDVQQTKDLIAVLHGRAGVIAKIERIEAVVPETLKGIIEAADGIMVARGDLAVEIGDAEVPNAQKLMINYSRQLNKPVITATQMMETMIHNVVPTRAEVSDVANAVFDGTDAVMLSAESATGDHPPLVIRTMAKVCEAAEKNPLAIDNCYTQQSCCSQRMDWDCQHYAVALAAVKAACIANVKAIVALTESGDNAFMASRVRSALPIYGVSNRAAVVGKMALYRGVCPIELDSRRVSQDEAFAKLKTLNLLQAGDEVVVLTEECSLAIVTVE